MADGYGVFPLVIFAALELVWACQKKEETRCIADDHMKIYEDPQVELLRGAPGSHTWRPCGRLHNSTDKLSPRYVMSSSRTARLHNVRSLPGLWVWGELIFELHRIRSFIGFTKAISPWLKYIWITILSCSPFRHFAASLRTALRQLRKPCRSLMAWELKVLWYLWWTESNHIIYHISQSGQKDMYKTVYIMIYYV